MTTILNMLNDTIPVPESKRIKFTSQASVGPRKSESSVDVINSGASVFSSREKECVNFNRYQRKSEYIVKQCKNGKYKDYI